MCPILSSFAIVFKLKIKKYGLKVWQYLKLVSCSYGDIEQSHKSKKVPQFQRERCGAPRVGKMHGVRNLHPNTFVKKSTLNSDESVSLTCHLTCTNLHSIDIDKDFVLSSGVKVTASLVTQCSKQRAVSPQIPKTTKPGLSAGFIKM